ncbi:MAG: hypothetical protein HY735_20710 [Verrucomicrobia bacterium]|nr:hypothetical protein [Verrucomicrobiota bacterium]
MRTQIPLPRRKLSRRTFPANLVAADVRRLILSCTNKVRASLRRPLPFRGPKREFIGGILSPTIATASRLFLALVVSPGAADPTPPPVPIVLAGAAPAERLAARELASYLRRLYPRESFAVTERLPESGRCILVGSAFAEERVRTHAAAQLAGPESFAVFTTDNGPRDLAVIAGADPRGTARGVYALLERLGCGFFLSYDTFPPARTEPFSFKGWNLSDRPLVRDRLVFNWHNFLSGCSTWNLRDWNQWTAQAQKAGFNAIMVHAYGNNPMVTFRFNGKTKPVGYLSTTVKGRDWSTMHVNDVRQLWGGEVFSQPVFGAQAALAPDEARAEAAQKLMHDVFAHAAVRGMDVYLANDVDTLSANPQELILTLPAEARFATGRQAAKATAPENVKLWLANPDTSDGYRFYKAQVEALLRAYPHVTWLVVWFRTGGTPWMELATSEMPAAWQKEYRAEIARSPDAEKLWHAPQIFALGKIVRAFDRALQELAAKRVQLAAGTWDFKFVAPCDRFFPPHIKLIGLDYNVLHGRPQLADAESRDVLRDVGAHRAVVPVVWAHHDDGHYIGRPYTPFAQFHSKLADAKTAGFGIIHWTTRPLDLFFKSHAEQVWASTQDRPLRATCDDIAARSFGADARGPMGEYFLRWVTGAPNFARETSNYFIDRPLTNVSQVVAGCRERLKLIERVDPARLTPDQRDRVNYFHGLEEFMVAFHQAQDAFQRTEERLKSGDQAGARAALRECRPESVIEQFAKFSSLGGITRGEQGLVVSLNLRWLPHFVRLRQAIGLEPIRYNFGPTSHDKLAQSRGTYSFHFDARREVWLTLGAEETGADVFVLPASASAEAARTEFRSTVGTEICRSGIESAKPIQFLLRPITARGESDGPSGLPTGEYRLRLWLRDPTSTGPGQRIFDLAVDGGSPLDRLDIFRLAGRPNAVVERTYDVAAVRGGAVKVTLTPVLGKALICGAVLEPVSME